MYGAVYSAIVNGSDSFASGSLGSGSVFLALLAIVAVVVIQLFVVKFLWNTVLVRVLSVAKPLPSLLYTLGLLVLVAMVCPGL
jgi:uncharacterized protein YqhQ